MSVKGAVFDQSAKEALKEKILAKYTQEESSYYSSARLWDDGIIDPRKTRAVLAQAFAATLHHQWERTQFGIFRM